MFKIDLHTHILPERWPDWTQRTGYPGWIALEHHKPCCARMLKTEPDGRVTFFREVESNCWDPAVRLQECDERMGPQSVQVLSTVPVMFSYWAKPQDAMDLSRLLNDHIAGVCASGPVLDVKLEESGGALAPHRCVGVFRIPRFIGLGTIPLQSPDLAIKELERCVLPASRGGLGFPGVQIGTNVNGANLDDPSLFPVLHAAEQLGACVFVHPWEMLGRERMPRYWLPWLVGMPAETGLAICSVIFGGVLERLPRLRLCFAHGGGSFPHTLGRIQHGFEARPDLCAVHNPVPPTAYLGRFYVDSLVHDPRALRYLIDLMSASRVALGSDYPFPLGEYRPGEMILSMPGIDESTKRRLLAGTAMEFLGLER